MKIHAGHIEVAVAKLLNYRIYTIVPNVSWGLGLRHECDMLALDDKGRFTEIEIKVTASDLKKDFMKWHGHKSEMISRLVYAMPAKLFEKHGALIPAHCGVITVHDMESPTGSMGFRASWQRLCKHKPISKPPDDKTILKFMSLGCMRIWSLKAHNNSRV